MLRKTDPVVSLRPSKTDMVNQNSLREPKADTSLKCLLNISY